MLLKKIKSMFAVGQLWQAIRISEPVVVQSNLGPVSLPKNDCNELREVIAVNSNCVLFQTHNANGTSTRLPWPTTKEIAGASPGVLTIVYDSGVTLALTLCE